MKEEYKRLEEQQMNNYILAVKEIINNNTNSLFDNDITSLIIKPPLDSMDVIKNKYLDLAKKYNIKVNNKEADIIIDKFRINLIDELDRLKKYRKETINNSIDYNDIDKIKISKKDLNNINKKINSSLKKTISTEVNDMLLKNINDLYIGDISEKLEKEINKFFSKTYISTLLDSIDFKILVKDTTLINGIKEQKERFLFTKTNTKLNEVIS